MLDYNKQFNVIQAILYLDLNYIIVYLSIYLYDNCNYMYTANLFLVCQKVCMICIQYTYYNLYLFLHFNEKK